MAHVLRYKLVGALEDGSEISTEARDVYTQYVADGKILDFDKTTGIAGTFCFIRFNTEADCDAYMAEMSAIDEETTSGDTRSDLTRYDE